MKHILSIMFLYLIAASNIATALSWNTIHTIYRQTTTTIQNHKYLIAGSALIGGLCGQLPVAWYLHCAHNTPSQPTNQSKQSSSTLPENHELCQLLRNNFLCQKSSGELTSILNHVMARKSLSVATIKAEFLNYLFTIATSFATLNDQKEIEAWQTTINLQLALLVYHNIITPHEQQQYQTDIHTLVEQLLQTKKTIVDLSETTQSATNRHSEAIKQYQELLNIYEAVKNDKIDALQHSKQLQTENERLQKQHADLLERLRNCETIVSSYKQKLIDEQQTQNSDSSQ